MKQQIQSWQKIKLEECSLFILFDSFLKVSYAILFFLSGIFGYLKLGIKPDKLVLGVPWYGYDYPCETLSKVSEYIFMNILQLTHLMCSRAESKQVIFLFIYLLCMHFLGTCFKQIGHFVMKPETDIDFLKLSLETAGTNGVLSLVKLVFSICQSLSLLSKTSSHLNKRVNSESKA